MTSAHGHDTTRNVRARYTQRVQSPRAMLGTTAMTIAARTTAGV